jgi:four helix bundle protein
MLRIYSTIIEVLLGLRPVVTQIEAHDRDLARQLRRAASRIALNVSEASGSNGGTRRERYRNALGSARETGACLDVAIALGTSRTSTQGCLRSSIGFVRRFFTLCVRRVRAGAGDSVGVRDGDCDCDCDSDSDGDSGVRFCARGRR